MVSNIKTDVGSTTTMDMSMDPTNPPTAMDILPSLMVNSHGDDYLGIISVVREFLSTYSDAVLLEQHVTTTKGNLIAVFGDPTWVINCHLDTVPPSGNWSHPPLAVTVLGVVGDGSSIPDPIKGPVAYGLGACDVKGTMASLLSAVATTTSAGHSPKDVLLLFSFDEESGPIDSGVTHFLDSELAAGLHLALVCEPTSCQVATSHPGYASFLVKEQAKPQHTSLSTQGSVGPGAVVKAARTILSLADSGFTVAKVEGGTRGNVGAGSCTIKCSIRSTAPHQEIIEAVKACSSADAGITPSFLGPALTGDLLDDPKTGPSIPDGLGKLMRYPHGPIKVPYWSEASLFEEAGIPSVVFGAGSIEQAHGPDEYVPLDDLVNATDVFCSLLTSKSIVHPQGGGR